MLKKMVKIIIVMFYFLGSISIFSKEETPLIIGAIYNLSGSEQDLGIESVKGAQLAIDKINATGGLLGRKVELLVKDGKSQTSVITQAAQQLSRRTDVIAVMGLSDTDMAMAAIPSLAENKKLFITSGATSPDLPAEAPGWVFLACFTDKTQATQAADFAYHTLKAKTALLITQEDSSYTLLLKKFFSSHYLKLDGKIIGQIPFHQPNIDLTISLQQFKKQAIQPDIIYLAGLTEPSLDIIPQIRKAGFNQPIIGGDSLDVNELNNLPSHLTQTIYFTTHAFIDKSNPKPEIQYFIQDYQSKYHQLPISNFSGLGYDTVGILAAAVKQADSIKPEEIRDNLLTLAPYSGVTGTVVYNNTYVPQKQVTIIRFESGKRRLESN